MDQPVFEIILDYKAMLMEIWNMARKEPILRTRAGKNFRCAPWVGGWYKGELGRGEPAYVNIGWDVRFRKMYKGIRGIGTGIFFDDRKEGYSIQSYSIDSERCYDPVKYYRKRDLIFSDYSKQVISFWEKMLR